MNLDGGVEVSEANRRAVIQVGKLVSAGAVVICGPTSHLWAMLKKTIQTALLGRSVAAGRIASRSGTAVSGQSDHGASLVPPCRAFTFGSSRLAGSPEGQSSAWQSYAQSDAATNRCRAQLVKAAFCVGRVWRRGDPAPSPSEKGYVRAVHADD